MSTSLPPIERPGAAYAAYAALERARRDSHTTAPPRGRRGTTTPSDVGGSVRAQSSMGDAPPRVTQGDDVPPPSASTPQPRRLSRTRAGSGGPQTEHAPPPQPIVTSPTVSPASQSPATVSPGLVTPAQSPPTSFSVNRGDVRVAQRVAPPQVNPNDAVHTGMPHAQPASTASTPKDASAKQPTPTPVWRTATPLSGALKKTSSDSSCKRSSPGSPQLLTDLDAADRGSSMHLLASDAPTAIRRHVRWNLPAGHTAQQEHHQPISEPPVQRDTQMTGSMRLAQIRASRSHESLSDAATRQREQLLQHSTPSEAEGDSSAAAGLPHILDTSEAPSVESPGNSFRGDGVFPARLRLANDSMSQSPSQSLGPSSNALRDQAGNSQVATRQDGVRQRGSSSPTVLPTLQGNHGVAKGKTEDGAASPKSAMKGGEAPHDQHIIDQIHALVASLNALTKPMTPDAKMATAMLIHHVNAIVGATAHAAASEAHLLGSQSSSSQPTPVGMPLARTTSVMSHQVAPPALLGTSSASEVGSSEDPQRVISTAPPSEHGGKVGSFYSQGSFKSGSQSTRSNVQYASPLVSELAMQSFQLSAHDEPLCATVTVQCAILFIDISGYSALTTQLANKGAYLLFDVVNAYLNDIIDVVMTNKGQIVKFAGDAIMALWYFEKPQDSVRCAAHCAAALQEKCRTHAVKETNVTLSIHIGLACGPVTSTVFRSTTVKHMQPHFHMISGTALHAAGECVAAAKSGEVFLTRDAARLCCRGAVTAKAGNRFWSLKSIDTYCGCDTNWHYANTVGADFVEDTENRRDNLKRFVPPVVAEQLKRGKLKSAMAEMRVLTVLFIHKSDESIDLADWFDEVQRVVDQHRCAILQVIDDDKGVHVVAAVNLFTTDRELAVTGIEIAKSLFERKAGCTIGVATGVTFCGMVGNDQAARYDITGWAVVRACRLMEHGVAHNLPVVIGESVVTYSGDASMTVPIGEAVIKGANDPVKVYAIATVPTRVLSSICCALTPCKAVHRQQYDEVVKSVIKQQKQRVALLVRGNSSTGKTALCVRALYDNAVTSIMHDAVEDSRPLDVVWTLANWFKHHSDVDLQHRAVRTIDALERSHNILSTRLGLELVATTIVKGQTTCLVVRQCQRLDSTSMSFLRQVMLHDTKGSGRWMTMVTVVPQNGLQPWSAISSMLGQGTVTVHLPAHLPPSECQALIDHRFGWDCDPALRGAIVDMSGRIPGNVDQLIQAVENAKPSFTYVTATGCIAAPTDAVMDLRKRSWNHISQSLCAKSSQLVAALSLRCLTALKVVAVLATDYTPLAKNLALHCVARAVPEIKQRHLAKDIELLIDLGLLERVGGNDEFIAFSNPAAQSVVYANLLPTEVKAVGQSALTRFAVTYDVTCAAEFFSLGLYHHCAGDMVQFEEHIKAGWSLLTEECHLAGDEDDSAADSVLNSSAAMENSGSPAAQFFTAEARREQRLATKRAEYQRARASIIVDLHRLGVDAEKLLPLITFAEPPTPEELETMRASPLRSVQRARQDREEQAERERALAAGEVSPAQLLRKTSRHDASTARLALHIVELRHWKPPMALGAMNGPVRGLAVTLCRVAIDAHQHRATPDSVLIPQVEKINAYAKMYVQIDRVIGFKPALVREHEHMLEWLEPGDFEVVSSNVVKFWEWIRSVLLPRVERMFTHIKSRPMYVPYPPSYEPIFAGAVRASLETALQKCIDTWDTCSTSALRDGLMELATQCWIPKNLEQTLEHQRDAYLRKRTEVPFSFVCLLYTNLQLSQV